MATMEYTREARCLDCKYYVPAPKPFAKSMYDYGYPDTDCYVKVNPKKNMIHVNGRNANSNLYSHSFVHELQRVLRLCGLDELANNFKL